MNERCLAVHDFDFYMGTWRIHNRRLTRRLAGSDEWEEFEGTWPAWPILGGAGNIDDNVVDLPNGIQRDLAPDLRPGRDRWSIWWLDGRSRSSRPPVVGGENGVGTSSLRTPEGRHHRFASVGHHHAPDR